MPGNSNTVPRADHNGSETDDEIDIRPPSKKRTKVRTLPERRTSAPKFEYPPGWPYPWARRTASDRGKAVGSQGKRGLRIPASNGYSGSWLILCRKTSRGPRRGAGCPEREDFYADGQQYTKGRPRGRPGRSHHPRALSTAGHGPSAPSCRALTPSQASDGPPAWSDRAFASSQASARPGESSTLGVTAVGNQKDC